MSDCLDQSDEQECRVVELHSSYNRWSHTTLEPRFLAPPPRKAAGKVPVDISVQINSLNKFDIIDSSFDLEFVVSAVWFDSRLAFNNLRQNKSSNTMGPSEKADIWFPFFVFVNTNQKLESLVDKKALMSVEKLGKGRLADDTFTENKLLFKGEENPIHYERVYSETFGCDYEMAWYPFDRQYCYIRIQPTQELINSVELLPHVFDYLGPEDLRQYMVLAVEMRREGKAVVVKVTIVRMLMSIVLTTMLPTILLNLIGHMANYFKAFFFEAIISLNVTVMLVLTTMFINVSNNLPKTAYIKMIDFWLLFNLFKPFIDIIMQTYIESLRTDDEEREVNKHGKVVTLGGADEPAKHVGGMR